MLPGSGEAPAATVFSAVFLVVACGGRSPEVSTRATPQASSSGASLERLVGERHVRSATFSIIHVDNGPGCLDRLSASP
jgi:hypothetical protein